MIKYERERQKMKSNSNEVEGLQSREMKNDK